MELKEKAKAFAIKIALDYLDKDPETNLPTYGFKRNSLCGLPWMQTIIWIRKETNYEII